MKTVLDLLILRALLARRASRRGIHMATIWVLLVAVLALGAAQTFQRLHLVRVQEQVRALSAQVQAMKTTPTESPRGQQ